MNRSAKSLILKLSFGIIILFFLINTLSAQQFKADVPWSDGRSKAEDLQVALITFSPGDMLTDWFGHTAIAVKDTSFHITRVYNFGLFSFDEGFVNRFAMGRLIFWAGDASMASIINRYTRANRTIFLQQLNITDAKKMDLAEKLAAAVLPENSHYLYHHYKDNCATRLRDLIDKAVDGELYRETDKPASLTFREHTRRYTAQSPLMQWLLMFLMNDSIDQPIKQWDEMFLPDELSKYVGRVKYPADGQKMLVTDSYIIYDSHRPPVPEQTPTLPLWTVISGVVLGTITILLGKMYQSGKKFYIKIFDVYSLIISLLFGFLGSALFFMGNFTDHLVTHGNENLFIANPLQLLIFFFTFILLFKKSAILIKWRGYLWMVLGVFTILLLMLKILPAFDQDNYMILAVLLPVNICFAISSRMNRSA